MNGPTKIKNKITKYISNSLTSITSLLSPSKFNLKSTKSLKSTDEIIKYKSDTILISKYEYDGMQLQIKLLQDELSEKQSKRNGI